MERFWRRPYPMNLRSLSTFVLLGCSLGAETIVIPAGTPVRVRIAETISSATAKVGNAVMFEVIDPITINEKVVIPNGTKAVGTVTVAEPKRRMGRSGKLDLTLSHIIASDGSKILITADQKAASGSNVGKTAVATAAVGVLFFPAAPLLLLVHGKDVNITQGTPVTVYINGDHKLDVK